MINLAFNFAVLGCVLAVSLPAVAEDGPSLPSQQSAVKVGGSPVAVSEAPSLRCFQRGINVVDFHLQPGASVQLPVAGLAGTVESGENRIHIVPVGDAICVVRLAPGQMRARP